MKKAEEQEGNLPAGRQGKWPNILFFIIFGLLIAGSVAFTYYRIMVKKDYVISAEAECDPTIEKCFIYVCDPVEDGDDCTGDPEEDTWYYKIIKRKAFNIPLCDPNTDEDCEALICPEGEAGCSYELCEEGNVDEIECNDPEQYNIDHPEEEEADEECEEGDEECLSEEEESECEEGDEECIAEETLSTDEEESECEEGDEECAQAEESEDNETREIEEEVEESEEKPTE